MLLRSSQGPGSCAKVDNYVLGIVAILSTRDMRVCIDEVWTVVADHDGEDGSKTTDHASVGLWRCSSGPRSITVGIGISQSCLRGKIVSKNVEGLVRRHWR